MATQTVQLRNPIHAISALLLTAALLLSAAPSHADNETSPSAVVSGVINTIMERLNTDKARLQDDPQALYTLVSEVVLPHFDIPRIARLALGKAARQAEPDTLAHFADEFRILLIRTYASSLSQYAGETLNFPTREKSQGRHKASVNLDIQRPGQAAVAMEFRMHSKSGPWLVYDIKIEGISLVANYRTEFASIVRKQGLDALIRQLHSRNSAVRIAVR